MISFGHSGAKGPRGYGARVSNSPHYRGLVEKIVLHRWLPPRDRYPRFPDPRWLTPRAVTPAVAALHVAWADAIDARVRP